jgi:hypothetical protein
MNLGDRVRLVYHGTYRGIDRVSDSMKIEIAGGNEEDNFIFYAPFRGSMGIDI